jgi:5'-nucleotidase / UDP-sugar diphosphatase
MLGRRSALALAAALLASACGEPAAPVLAPSASAPASIASAPRAPPVEVTLLFTSDEHGWLLPLVEGGVARGGAAEVLGRLTAIEHHCAPGAAGCVDPATLLLSGGDNYTGPAISSYFEGEPMAEAIAAMGYAASAFGNHELDFGREAFVKNRARARVAYLAANVHATDPALAGEMNLPAFLLFERRGVKIGVVGLATETTLTTAMASRFAGVAIDPEEPALVRAVPEARAAGADAVVLIAHECPDVLAPILDRHPDLHLAFAGAGHCHKVIRARAGGADVISPGWRFENYLRVRLAIDKARAAEDRVVSVSPEVVPVAHAEGDAGAEVDAKLAERSAAWKAKLDAALGEEIGYAAAGFDKDSKEIAAWIAGAIRAELGTDVALLNTGGIRQSLPKGPITKASVWSILPFDNKLVVCKLKGRDLIVDLETKEAAASGVSRDGKAWRIGKSAIDPDRVYTVATIDFLYHGGSHFLFAEQDPSPKETGLDWRAPVVAWTKRQKTSAASPLEKHLGP